MWLWYDNSRDEVDRRIVLDVVDRRRNKVYSIDRYIACW